MYDIEFTHQQIITTMCYDMSVGPVVNVMSVKAGPIVEKLKEWQQRLMEALTPAETPVDYTDEEIISHGLQVKPLTAYVFPERENFAYIDVVWETYRLLDKRGKMYAYIPLDWIGSTHKPAEAFSVWVKNNASRWLPFYSEEDKQWACMLEMEK